MNISLIYISNRYGGLDILKGNLDRQTMRDFELVFVDGLYHERKDEVKEYFKDYNLKHIDQTVLPMEGFHTRLARADNLAFKNASGELLILLQDYIYIQKDAFKKFWELHKRYNGKALLTGMGHIYYYPDTDEIVKPKGKLSVFERDYIYQPDIVFWFDPRCRNLNGVRPAEPVEWEMNWASIPRDVIYELGGMDEEYDRHGFAYDNTNIAERASMLGYLIFLDESNQCFGFNHDKWWENPLKKNRISPINYHLDQMNKMRRGIISPKLNYLS